MPLFFSNFRPLPITLSLAILAACGGAEQAPLGQTVDLGDSAAKNSINGSVVLENLGACAGVKVQLLGPVNAVTLTTGEGGAFSAPDLQAAAYKVLAEAEGYAPYEGVFVFDARAAAEMPQISMGVELVLVSGQVELSDGENPAGTSVAISGETDLAVPAGLNCEPAGDVSELFQEDVVIGAEGTYQVYVPRSGTNAAATIERPDYTRERVPVDIAAATGGVVNAGTTVLYPLTGFVNIVGGKLHNNNEIDLQVSAFNGASHMALGVQTDATFGWCAFEAWQSFSATPQMPQTTIAGLPEGEQTLCVKVRNGQNQQIILKADLFLDRIAPATPTLLLGSGQAYVANGAQTLQVLAVEAGTGLASVELYDSLVPGVQIFGYSSVLPYNLVAQGQHNVTAHVVDKAGNRSLIAGSTSVVFDAGAPSFDPPLFTQTGGNIVQIEIANIDDISPREVRYGYVGPQTLNIASAAFQPLDSASAATVVAVLPALDGSYTLNVQLRDLAGNLSAIYSSAVVVDQTAPIGVSLTGPQQTNAASVGLNLTGSDANGLFVRLSESPDFIDATWFAFTPNTSFTLSAGDGLKTIYGQFRDNAHNYSQILLFGVSKDQTPPTDVSLLMAESPYTQSPVVSLYLSASDASQVMLSESATFDDADWENFSFLKTFTLSNSEGLHSVYAKFRDNAGNESVVASDSVTLDLNDPAIPSVVLAGGAPSVNSRAVTLALEFSSGDEVEMQISESSSFAGAPWMPVATLANIQLSAGDQAKTVFVRARDASGRISANGQDSVVLDMTGPGSPTIDIDGGAPTTNDFNINLTLGNHADAAQMQIGEDAAFTGQQWQAFSANTSFTLGAGDGLKNVYVKYRDALGNEGPAASASILLDTSAPGNSQLAINANAAYTTNSLVTVSLFSDGANQMQLSENANFAGAAWQAYSTTFAYAITTGQGAKVIYARFRDAALNITGPVSDGIQYDSVAPAGLSISINGGINQTNNANVSLALTVGDAGEIQVSQNASFAGESWITAVTSLSRVLSGGDGAKTIYMRARDAAGNLAATVTDGITLDTQGPLLTDVSINGGTATTNSTTVSVASVESGGSSVMEIRDESGALFSGPFESPKTVVLSAGDGVRTITVRTWDDLGNASSSAFDAIVVDTIAPTGAVQINANAAYTTSRNLTLSLSANDLGTGIAGVKIAANQAALAATNTVGFDAVKAWTLPDVQGLQSVWLRFVDVAGNASADVSDTIIFDNVAPSGLSVLANAGLNLTNNRQVQLAISQSGGSEMMVSDDGSFAGAAWTPVNANVVYNLTGGDGAKTVYLKVRDAAGNVAATVTDGITLDTTPPSLTQVQLQNGALAFNDLTLGLASVADGSAQTMTVSDDNGILLNNVAYASNRAITLSVGAAAEGDRSVYVTVADLAGNQSQVRSDNILIDRQAPTGSLAINNGAAHSNTSAVSLALSASDLTSGVVYVQLSNALAAVSAASEAPFEAAKTWFLDNVALGQQQSRSVWARYRDLAGNYSSIVSDSIMVDRMGPSGSIDIALALTNQTLIAVNLTYDGDATLMKLSNGAACAGGNWLPVTTATLWTLTGVPGLNEVSVQFQDGVGNIGACQPSDSIDYDTIGPTPTSLSVSGNIEAAAGYSNQTTLAVASTQVSAGAACAGAEIDFDLGFIAPLAMSLNACSGVGGFPVNNLQLPSIDGAYDIFVRYRDSLGNYGPITAATIVLDRSVPAASAGGFNFVQGAYSNQNNLTLNLLASGASEVQVQEGASCGGAWQNYSSSLAFALTPSSPTRTLLADNFVSSVSASNWIATLGSPLVNTVGPTPKPSPVNALNLDANPDAVVSKNISGYANYTYSYYWSRTATPDVGENLYFEYFDGSAWRTVNVHTNADGSTLAYTFVSGTLPPQTQQIRLRATGNSTVDDYSVDNIVIRGDDLDGAVRTVAVRYRDQAGNESACYTGAITVDTVAPDYAIAVTGSEGLAGLTTQQLGWVSAAYAPADAADIRLANTAGFFGSIWTPFTALTTWALDPGDGVKTVYGQIRDLAGNVSPSASTWIVLDQEAPQNPFMYIDEPGSVTNKPAVDLFLSAVGATQMRIANSLAALSAAPWQSYATAATANITGGGNPRFVYVQFRDSADNHSQVVFDSIDLDQTAPVPVAVTILGGAFINSVSASLTVTATDAGAITMVVSNDLLFNEAPQSFAPNVSHLLPAGDGAKQVHVRFFDEAGNWADLSSNIVVLDTSPPTTPQIRTYSRSLDADTFGVEIYQYSATDANFEAFELAGGSSYPLGFSTVSYSAAQTWFVFDLYQDAENVLQVRARDKAGNVSNIGQVVIIEDSTPPFTMTNIQVRNGRNKATLIWDQPVEDDIVGYYIHYGTQTRNDFWSMSQGEYVYVGQFADQGDSPIWVPGGETVSYTLSGLPNATDIYITVSAVDAAGQESALGNEVRASPNVVTPDYKYPPVKQISTFGEIESPGAMVRNGSYYYLAIDNEIQVWSRIAPGSDLNPTKIATAKTTSDPDAKLGDLELHVSNNRLYAIEMVPDPTKPTGLRPNIAVFNVSTAAAPVYVTSVALGTDNLALAIESYNDRLYVTTFDYLSLFVSSDHKIGVFDISAASSPVWLEAESHATTTIGLNLAVDDTRGYLYVTEFFVGIAKYDVSGGDPVKVAQTAPGAAYGGEQLILRDTNNLYIASGSSQLKLFNVAGTDIAYTGYTFTATEGTSSSWFNVFDKVDIDGTTIFAVGAGGVGRFSATTTNVITTDSRFLDSTGSLGVESVAYSPAANYIYAFDGFEFHVYNMSAASGTLARYKGAKRPYYDIDAMEGLIVTAEGFDGIAVYSYEGGVPHELSRINYGANACRFTEVKLVQHNGYRMAYALSQRPAGVMSINLSDPYNPTIQGEWATCSSYTNIIRGLAVGGGRISYILEQPTNIYINRQTIPAIPTNLGDQFCTITSQVLRPIKDMFYYNDRLHVANEGSTDTFLLSNCAHQGAMNRDRWDSMTLVGDHLYYHDGSQIDRYDITDPNSWDQIGSTINVPNASNGKGIVYDGAYLYSYSNQGLTVIDDSDLTGVSVGEGSDPFGGNNLGTAAGMVLDKNWLIGLSKDKGLIFWQLANPTRITPFGEASTTSGNYYDFDRLGYWGLLAGQTGDYPGWVSRGTSVFDMRGSGEMEMVKNIEYDGVFDFGYANQTIRNDAYNNQAFVGVTDDTYGGMLGVYRVEMDTPDTPAILSLKLAGGFGEMDLDGNRAYIVNNLNQSEIMVFDISSTPTLIHSHNHGATIRRLLVSGGFAWIQDFTNGVLHVYSVRGDTWTLIHSFNGFANISSWAVNATQVWMEVSEIGAAFETVKVYDLRKIYNLTGNPDIVASIYGKSLYSDPQFAGSDIFGFCCQWLKYAWPNTLTTTFTGGQSSTNLGDGDVVGPHILGIDSSSGLRLRRFDIE